MGVKRYTKYTLYQNTVQLSFEIARPKMGQNTGDAPMASTIQKEPVYICV